MSSTCRLTWRQACRRPRQMRSERASAAGEGWSGVESGGGERTARNVTSPCSFDAVAPSMSQSVPQLQVLDAFENSFWLASCLPLDVVWSPLAVLASSVTDIVTNEPSGPLHCRYAPTEGFSIAGRGEDTSGLAVEPRGAAAELWRGF